MDRATITYLEQRYRYYGVTSPHGVKRRHRLADHANSGSGRHTEHGGGFSAVQPVLRAGLNNYFLVVRPHHDDLAAKVIRQRIRKIVYRVSFVRQIG